MAKMTKIILSILFPIILFADDFNPMSGRNEMMETSTATKRWGNEKFTVEKFKKATISERAKMAADLVSSSALVGKTNSEIKTLLGPYTGHYRSRRIPAYLIEEGWKTHKDSWQLVFFLDQTDKVTSVKFHKNCCYSTEDHSDRKPSDK